MSSRKPCYRRDGNDNNSFFATGVRSAYSSFQNLIYAVLNACKPRHARSRRASPSPVAYPGISLIFVPHTFVQLCTSPSWDRRSFDGAQDCFLNQLCYSNRL